MGEFYSVLVVVTHEVKAGSENVKRLSTGLFYSLSMVR